MYWSNRSISNTNSRAVSTNVWKCIAIFLECAATASSFSQSDHRARVVLNVRAFEIFQSPAVYNINRNEIFSNENNRRFLGPIFPTPVQRAKLSFPVFIVLAYGSTYTPEACLAKDCLSQDAATGICTLNWHPSASRYVLLLLLLSINLFIYIFSFLLLSKQSQFIFCWKVDSGICFENSDKLDIVCACEEGEPPAVLNWKSLCASVLSSRLLVSL